MSRNSWLLIAWGVGFQVAGDALWSYYEHVAGTDPYPSAADALYLVGYVILGAGFVLRVRMRSGGGDQASLLDATIVAIGAGVVAWVFLMAPYATDPELGTFERMVSLAYPLADVLLLAVVARLVFVPGRRTVADLLLGLGLVVMLAADANFSVQELAGTYETGGFSDFAWLAAYSLIGAGALHPTAGRASGETALGGLEISRPRLAALALASLLAPGLLAKEALAGQQLDLLVIAAGSAALFLLVLVRMEGLVRHVQRQAQALGRLAATDGLTGLPNRRTWDEEIPRALAGARRTGTPLCVAVIDLDRFKRFNDERGHLAGDDLLRAAASAWLPHLRPGDLLARYGGEEFAVLLPDCTVPVAITVVERLRAVMPLEQTFSAGVAAWDGEEAAEALVARADLALYDAKRDGRARTVVAERRVPAV
jgi:diguanylate cyclase (GGDEF)-like protein